RDLVLAGRCRLLARGRRLLAERGPRAGVGAALHRAEQRLALVHELADDLRLLRRQRGLAARQVLGLAIARGGVAAPRRPPRRRPPVPAATPRAAIPPAPAAS